MIPQRRKNSFEIQKMCFGLSQNFIKPLSIRFNANAINISFQTLVPTLLNIRFRLKFHRIRKPSVTIFLTGLYTIVLVFVCIIVLCRCVFVVRSRKLTNIEKITQIANAAKRRDLQKVGKKSEILQRGQSKPAA